MNSITITYEQHQLTLNSPDHSLHYLLDDVSENVEKYDAFLQSKTPTEQAVIKENIENYVSSVFEIIKATNQQLPPDEMNTFVTSAWIVLNKIRPTAGLFIPSLTHSPPEDY